MHTKLGRPYFGVCADSDGEVRLYSIFESRGPISQLQRTANRYRVQIARVILGNGVDSFF